MKVLINVVGCVGSPLTRIPVNPVPVRTPKMVLALVRL
jgi:hypothetical protein